jgi:hypothetical protein
MNPPRDSRVVGRRRFEDGATRDVYEEAMNADPSDDDVRPWEWAVNVRRDCEPHRGGVLLALGRISLMLGLLSPLGGLTAPAGFAVGAVALVMCEREERDIAAGRRHPLGRRPLREARDKALCGAALSGLSGIVGLTLLLSYFL